MGYHVARDHIAVKSELLSLMGPITALLAVLLLSALIAILHTPNSDYPRFFEDETLIRIRFDDNTTGWRCIATDDLP